MYYFNVHFLLYGFFANDITYYFIFILDYRKDFRQKANSIDFLIRIQNGW